MSKRKARQYALESGNKDRPFDGRDRDSQLAVGKAIIQSV